MCGITNTGIYTHRSSTNVTAFPILPTIPAPLLHHISGSVENKYDHLHNFGGKMLPSQVYDINKLDPDTHWSQNKRMMERLECQEVQHSKALCVSVGGEPSENDFVGSIHTLV
jgi:hypothetical protein